MFQEYALFPHLTALGNVMTALGHRPSSERRSRAEELLRLGFRLITGGTDNHLILIDLTPKNVTGKVAAQALDRAG